MDENQSQHLPPQLWSRAGGLCHLLYQVIWFILLNIYNIRKSRMAGGRKSPHAPAWLRPWIRLWQIIGQLLWYNVQLTSMTNVIYCIIIWCAYSLVVIWPIEIVSQFNNIKSKKFSNTRCKDYFIAVSTFNPWW